jgi:hypothetical protein
VDGIGGLLNWYYHFLYGYIFCDKEIRMEHVNAGEFFHLRCLSPVAIEIAVQSICISGGRENVQRSLTKDCVKAMKRY